MNNNSLKKRLLSVAMAAVMVFSMLPTTAWAAMVETPPAASDQTQPEQTQDGGDAYAVTQSAGNGVAAQAKEVWKTCLDLTTMGEDHNYDGNGWHWVPAPASILTLKNVQIETTDEHALILPDGATVQVEGDCSITGGSSPNSAVWSKGKVTVELEKDASLTVNGLGWRADGDMTVTKGYYSAGELTVNFLGNKSINTSTSGAAIRVANSNKLTVTGGAKVTAKGGSAVKNGDSYGVFASTVIVENGGTLIADGGSASSTGTSRGISGHVIVDNGTVTATGGSGIQSYGVSGDITVSNGAVLNANGGEAKQDLTSSIKPTSGGIHLDNFATIDAATVNANGGTAPCGNDFASVGLQMTSGSTLTVNSGGELNAYGGQLTEGSSTNERGGFSAGINMAGPGAAASLLVNGTGSVTAIGSPKQTDDTKIYSYGVNYTDTGDLTIQLSGAASFKAAGGTTASRVKFTQDTVSIKGSTTYLDFDNVTDGYTFYNSTYVKDVKDNVPAQSLVVTACKHSAGFTGGKCDSCGYPCPHTDVGADSKCSTCGMQMAAKVTASGEDTLYVTINEAMAAAFAEGSATVTLLADAVMADATFTKNSVELEMGGYTLGGSFTLASNADLTIRKDNGAAGKLTANIKVDSALLVLEEDASRTATSVVALHGLATLHCKSTDFGGTVELHRSLGVNLIGSDPCTFAGIVNKTDSPICLYDIVTLGMAVLDRSNTMLTRDGATLDADAAVAAYTIQTCTHPSNMITDGACACGMLCPHERYTEEGKCAICGAGAAMVLEQAGGKKTYGSYLDMWELLQNATEPVNGTLKLLQDVSYDKNEQHGLLMFSGNLTLDLNGNTLSCTDPNKMARILQILGLDKGSTMTIIDSIGTGTCSVTLSPVNMTLIIRSGKFEAPYESGYAAQVNPSSSGAKLRIEGGTLTGVGGLKHEDGTLELAGGTITKALWLTTRDTSGDLRELLAEGYIYQLDGTPLRWDSSLLNSVKELRGGTITVVKCTHESMTDGKCDYCNAAYEATVTDTAGKATSYKTFSEAIAAAANQTGCTVKLLTDVSVAANYTIASGTFTIDFNGKRLTVEDTQDFFVKGSAVVTLQDSAEIKVSQPYCRPNVTDGGKIIVNSGKFGGAIVKYNNGTLLLNGGEFGRITLMDPEENESMMELLGAGKTYLSITDPTHWPNDKNADTTSAPNQKSLHEVKVVNAPLRITQQVPENGPLNIYDNAPTNPGLTVTAWYDTTRSGDVTATLYYSTGGTAGWSSVEDAAEVSSDGNGTVTVTSNTTLKNGLYQFRLTYNNYWVESRVVTVVVTTCDHPKADDTNGKCSTCQHQFVATLTAPDKTVTGYDMFSEALSATSASVDAESAEDYVLNLWQDVNCATEQDYTPSYYYTPNNAVFFTLNGNNHSISNTKENATHCFQVFRGKVTLNNCKFDDKTVTATGATTITGCTFNGSVTLTGGGSQDPAVVNSGTFNGEVTIGAGGIIIEDGTFKQAVTINSGSGYTINNAVFNSTVTAENGAVVKIYSGTFKELKAYKGGSAGVVLWGGTYDQVTNQGGMADGLLGGYTDGSGGAFYVDAANNDLFRNAEAAANPTLNNVKVIKHFHNVNQTTGACACGIAYTASVNDGTKTNWYKTLGAALAAVKTPSASAQDATKYTVKLYQDTAEDVRIDGGKFTLDLTSRKAGSTSTPFTVSGSAVVILTGGEVSCDMQVKDTANLTVNGTKLGEVELFGNASLTSNGASMDYLQNQNGTPAATVTGGTITRITMRGGTVELKGSVTIGGQVEVFSGVLTVTAQSGEPEFQGEVWISNGGKLVASAGKFNRNVEFSRGARGELSGGMYGYLKCGGDQLLNDVLKPGYAFFAGSKLENGYVTTLEGHTYTVESHPSHHGEWNTTTHEKKCGCGLLEATDYDAPVIGFLNGAELKTENGRQVMDVTNNVTYTVTDDNRVTVTVSYDNGTPEEVIPYASNWYELLPSKGDGKLVTITATDAAGNETTVAFTLYRLVNMRVIDHVGVAVDEADLNKAVRNGQTYTLRVTMLPGYTGAGGLALEQGALAAKKFFTGNDTDGYTIEVTADFNNSLLKILNAHDNTPPTAEIAIQNSSFKDFLNRIFFGLFFKETQTVNVTAADVGAGLDKAEYLLSGTAFTDKAVVEAATGWTALTLDAGGKGSFTVDPNSKSFLYVKATDKEGNVTVVNADGMVVYTDADQITERISFTRTSTDDCVFYVKDNGNTVKNITMGGRELVKDTEYLVGTSDNGQLSISLTNSFLQTLTADSYTLTVSYHPMGETYVSGGDNQAPATTTVVLNVGKATVDATIASLSKAYDSEPVTPSATTESDGAKTWAFKPDRADPSAYTTTAPEDAGTYTVRLTVAETERYNAIEKTATFTITQKDIELHTPALENKIYDGSTSIVCKYFYPDQAMEGKISGDDLSVVMGQANADSPDVGNRTVTFKDFALAGSDAPNYNLTAQPVSGSAAITVRTLTIDNLTVSDKFYDGSNTAAINGTPTLVNLADGESLMLRCGTPTFDTVAVGDNIPVNFTAFTIADTATGKAGNYSLTQPTGITASIKAYAATGAEYTATTGEWTNQDFVVTASDGWQVSTTNTANGDWRDGLTRSDETGTGSLTFYVKNTADGYISEAITLTYKIDKTNPTGEIRIDERNAWQSFWNAISFDLFYKNEQTVTLTAADEASGVAATAYLLSEEDYSVAQLDGMTFQPYTAPVAITPDSKLIAYARITDAAGNVTYLRSDGVVLDATAPVITGVDDGAIYCGSVTFTVTDAYLDTVTVDGAAAVSASTSTAENTYVIKADNRLHTIVATDRAGNSTQVQITVNDGHTVGTPATCKDPAVCKYCGKSFGDLAPDNHDGLRRVAKVNATSTTDGNIEYWYCSGCGKHYLDAAAAKEITHKDTILPAIGLRIVDDVKTWNPSDKPLGVIFYEEHDSFTVQVDGVTVDPSNYKVTTDPDTGKLVVTFRTPFLHTLALGEHTITLLSDDGSASVSFELGRACADTSRGKNGGKGKNSGENKSGGTDGVKSAGTGDGFSLGGMVVALLVSSSALAMLTARARRKKEEEK